MQTATHNPDNNINEILFEIQAAAESTRKRRGETAEAVFLAKALSLGFRLAKPWGDSERYDFILTAGHGFFRVQIKSTERYDECRYRVSGAGWKNTYTCEEIDFLVAYIVPEDLWYVIPIEAFASRKSLRFYPRGKGKGLLEKFRETWCLMACPRVEKNPKKQKAKPNRSLSKSAVKVSASKSQAARNHARNKKQQLTACRCPELEVRCAICPLLHQN